MTTAERYRELAELIVRRELAYMEAMGQQYITDDTISRAATALREAAEMQQKLDDGTHKVVTVEEWERTVAAARKWWAHLYEFNPDLLGTNGGGE